MKKYVLIALLGLLLFHQGKAQEPPKAVQWVIENPKIVGSSIMGAFLVWGFIDAYKDPSCKVGLRDRLRAKRYIRRRNKRNKR